MYRIHALKGRQRRHFGIVDRKCSLASWDAIFSKNLKDIYNFKRREQSYSTERFERDRSVVDK